MTLDEALASGLPGDTVQTFIAMRYWSPLTEQVAAEVAAVTGGLLAPHVENGLTVMWVSYVLWALSVPIAMSVLVVLILKHREFHSKILKALQEC